MTKLGIWKSRIALGDILGLLGALLIIVMLYAANSATIVQPKMDNPTVQSVTPQVTSGNKAPPPPFSGSFSPPQAPKPLPASRPSTVLDLSNWKLTLPIDTPHTGTPDEIKQPGLATFTLNPYFRLNSSENGVIFRADVDGVTTSGSNYPRSELREMTDAGKSPASWSNSSGTHTMFIKQAITHLPIVKPEVVAGQIHDASDDVIMVRLDGKRLFIEGGGQVIGELDPNYSLGAIFEVKIVAAEGHIKVYYNDKPKVDYSKSGSGYYFKAGCYALSNTSKGDRLGAYGEVVIYDLRVSHN